MPEDAHDLYPACQASLHIRSVKGLSRHLLLRLMPHVSSIPTTGCRFGCAVMHLRQAMVTGYGACVVHVGTQAVVTRCGADP